MLQLTMCCQEICGQKNQLMKWNTHPILAVSKNKV